MAIIWQPAIVIEHEQKRWLEFPRLSSCARCQTGKGCGAGVFALFFAGRKPRLTLPESTDWQPGQHVRVGVAERQVLLASLALYGFPLLCFLLGLLVPAIVLPNISEAIVLILGIVCALLGLMLIRSRALRFQSLIIEPLVEQQPPHECDSQALG